MLDYFFRSESSLLVMYDAERAYFASNRIKRCHTLDSSEESVLIYPDTYNDMSDLIKDMTIKGRQKSILLCLLDPSNRGGDYFACKLRLYLRLIQSPTCRRYLPRSFTVSEFLHSPDKTFPLYIAKSNMQRQLGINIFRPTEDIETLSRKLVQDQTVIVQALALDPLLVLDRKVTMRFYVLIVVVGTRKEVYVYKNGFNYYTQLDWNSNIISVDQAKKNGVFQSINDNPKLHIASGYTDRDVYDTRPIDHQTLFKMVPWLEAKALECIKDCSEELTREIDSRDFKKTAQLFGCDIQPSDKETCYLCEYNRGPDLYSKDSVDGKIKDDMIKSMYNIILDKKISARENKWNRLV